MSASDVIMAVDSYPEATASLSSGDLAGLALLYLSIAACYGGVIYCRLDDDPARLRDWAAVIFWPISGTWDLLKLFSAACKRGW